MNLDNYQTWNFSSFEFVWNTDFENRPQNNVFIHPKCKDEWVWKRKFCEDSG